VAYQNLLTETRFESHFKELSGWNLERSITNEQKAEKLIHLESSRMILADVATEIEAISNLLIKPSYKLSSEEKDRKKALKSSKRLLLHEMNKQQRHLAVKTLFESCSDYLLPLQPLWMMNPLTVSENLPCIEGLFDVVIFDESSQIPLEDAIPSIYRAKRAVIVGDSNQMPPASFFSSKEETLTVLDQAERTLNSEMLKWHYRSKHPQLIQFSNQEFYEGELITFPPSTHEIPIEIVECNGVFEGGANLIEAKEIALFCSKSSPDKNQETLIIAFSKEQEKAILKELSKLNLNDIRTRNLENAQGIEADRVIISLGYAKNEEGQFRMNFGPVNQVNGANRLNVLFTRAKEKMILFRSVNSNDFQLSANRGVQVLKDFLSYCETVKWNKKSVVKLPFAHQQVKALLESQSLGFNYSQAVNGTALGYFISLDCRSILLVDPGMNEYEIDDVFSFVKILETHFKAVKIVLSVDLWKNPDRVKKDIVEFFL
ncbi:AAA domain-containing protein, partial [Crocinitomix sp.]|nr:AAA domain-containing protein [Crocinitomix sp.]